MYAHHDLRRRGHGQPGRAALALATELKAERLVAPGAGHFVAAAPGFAEHLEWFLVSAGMRRRSSASPDTNVRNR